jgi:hypothetical protein
VSIYEPRGSVAHQNPRARYLKSASLYAFDFGAYELDARLVGFQNLVVKARPSVFCNVFHGCGDLRCYYIVATSQVDTFAECLLLGYLNDKGAVVDGDMARALER